MEHVRPPLPTSLPNVAYTTTDFKSKPDRRPTTPIRPAMTQFNMTSTSRPSSASNSTSSWNGTPPAQLATDLKPYPHSSRDRQPISASTYADAPRSLPHTPAASSKRSSTPPTRILKEIPVEDDDAGTNPDGNLRPRDLAPEVSARVSRPCLLLPVSLGNENSLTPQCGFGLSKLIHPAGAS